MSLKSLLMPVLSERLLSLERMNRLRARAERRRQARGARHVVHYFHQVDDPYSVLAAQALPALVERYDIELVPHLVGPPSDAAAPERAKLVAYSRRDAALLARRYDLAYADTGAQPSGETVARAGAVLLDAIATGQFVARAGKVSTDLWRGGSRRRASDVRGAVEAAIDADALAEHVLESERLRAQLGHYLGATFHYGGEWYWGIDRLHHLETRLQALGARRTAGTDPLYPPGEDLREPLALVDPPAIDFFFSFRSPYSAIVVPRVFELARLTGAPLRLRYVLPMVMRGLPVPREKRRYIAFDTAREARLRGVPFGRLNDPVGVPTERGLSILPYAERAGRAPEYVASFMRGVWAEGVDAGSDRGLARLVERAGLDWTEARAAMRDPGWRAVAEGNRAEMFALGLWGVPSFRVGELAVWGQDRLWAVERALRAAQPAA